MTLEFWGFIFQLSLAAILVVILITPVFFFSRIFKHLRAGESNRHSHVLTVAVAITIGILTTIVSIRLAILLLKTAILIKSNWIIIISAILFLTYVLALAVNRPGKAEKASEAGTGVPGPLRVLILIAVLALMFYLAVIFESMTNLLTL